MPTFYFYDLDNTLYPKGARGGIIPEVTRELLTDISWEGDNKQIISTGRPKTHVEMLLSQSFGTVWGAGFGLFDAALYEDGMLIEFDGQEIFNARSRGEMTFPEYRASQAYIGLMTVLKSGRGREHLMENDFLLIPEGVVWLEKGVYVVKDYLEKEVLAELPADKMAPETTVLYWQDTRVRESLKLPFVEVDEAGSQALNAKRPEELLRLEQVVLSFLSQQYMFVEEVVKPVPHITGPDIYLDLYPVLEGGPYVKDFAIERILEALGIPPEATPSDAVFVYCGDGTNDLSAMEYLAKRFGANTHIVAPSNAKPVITNLIGSLDQAHGTVLQQDCTEFGVGLREYLGAQGLFTG